MKILIVGDSQANGPPGRSAEERLRSLGYQTMRVAMDGHGPVAYQNDLDGVKSRFLEAVRSFRPDAVLTIWGSNPTTQSALRAIRESVSQPVFASGPPRYPGAEDQQRSDRYKSIFQSTFPPEKYIDAYPWTGSSAPRASDGLHFTATGGRMWGAPLADEVHRRLSSSAPARTGAAEEAPAAGRATSTPVWVYGVGAAMATFAMIIVWKRR